MNVECHIGIKKDKYCRKFKRDSKNHKGKEKKNDDDSDADTIIVGTGDFFILFDRDVNLATQQSSWVIDSDASVQLLQRGNFLHLILMVILAVLGWAMMDQQMQLASKMYA